MSMDRSTLEVCIAIAEDVKLKAEMAAQNMSYGELYGEQCKIEAADEIIDRIKRVVPVQEHRTKQEQLPHGRR